MSAWHRRLHICFLLSAERERRNRQGRRLDPDQMQQDSPEPDAEYSLQEDLERRDRQREHRREMAEDADSYGDRERRSVLLFDEHDVHHMRYHDNLCRHRGVDQCAWPQCNLSCPKIRNPFTGEEMDFIDLLLQFGLDLSSIANALNMDLHTLKTMDHDHLLQLLTQHR